MDDLFSTPAAPVDTRPVLVGMNNPLSSRPEHALFPAPSGCTGYNLWQMVNEQCGLLRSEYLRAFDRRNVLDSTIWDAKLAKQRGPIMWRELEGRTVLLLGREVVASMRLSQPMPLVWMPPDQWRTGPQPSRWCYVPHPSGLNLWYNNPVCRLAVGLRLEQLVSS